MTEKKLSGKRVLMVIAPGQFRDEELFEPRDIFIGEGAEVDIASTTKSESTGMLGGKASPGLTINEVRPEKYDAIVVVGGMGSPEHLWHHRDLHDHLRQTARNNKVVAGICLSGAVLALAGVMSGKKGTVWPTPESVEALKTGGCTYLKEHVVKDGLVVTADGPEAAKEFGRAVVEAVSSIPTRV